MNTVQSIKRARTLLELMSEDPDEVLQVLDEANQFALLKELDALAEQANAVQSGADLLGLVDAIQLLVEDRTELRELLLSSGTDIKQQQLQRKVTLADQQATAELSVSTQQWVPQICGAVIECRTQLQAALFRRTELEQRPVRGEKA